jgi:hypothetical protein
MQRVAIVGLHGAGKTTIALALGKATGLQVLHTDRMFLTSQGRVMTASDRQTTLRSVLDQPAYIFEGAHGWTFAPRIAGCDTLIWMDIGIIRRALNALRRRRRALRAHQSGQMGRDAAPRPLAAVRFWGWFFLGHISERKALVDAVAGRPTGVDLIHLRSFAEVQAFLDSLQK